MHVLWNSLSIEDQSKTHASKKVSDISTTENGVVVSCTDGTSYEGSMVIGADGAHSVVRKHMRLMALRDQQREKISASVNEERPFLTTYRCFWVLLPLLPNIKAGDANETHGPTITVQFFVGEDYAIMGVYERLDEPTREPPRYTSADEQSLVEKWGHLALTKGGQLTLGQAYAQKITSGLVNLEEGVLKNWSWGGRMVLVGDAAHKFTPSTGAGCNNGIIDIVVLANQLNRAFSSSVPSSNTLATAFKEYQDARFDVVTAGCSISNQTTAMATWSNVIFKFLDVYVFANQTVQKFFINLGVGATAKTPVFDYIEGEEEIVGSVPWVHAIPSSRTQRVL
jgi:2-polyprenyl-6-methoxyphenol hydroxylase-like FAD-dependent oxidoreductase